ncbi:UPF0489 family protein [Roseofilum capinflatum]|uniref:UPF0489 family protein n=1 Tax=Roseofilum capinflatum BLCC-M114 TaxID=3022440 RepID=A0ABT7B5B0_9CYAN|nr:UPF0489 family protein [Roseofilum capinflatum]MDJ1174357.1 UPF0489 family protein [Roseofilum capinflatum BLCC-M114]
MIPVFTFEEHNEAFLIWHYAIHKKLIPESDNILFHVDEHSDFNYPSFKKPLDQLNTRDLSEVYQFTYNELNIANFIVPALYQGVFKEEYWLRHPSPKLSTKRRTYKLYFPNPEHDILVAKPLKPEETGLKNVIKLLGDPSCKLAKIQHLTVDDEFPDDQTVVLDIDLDYFSCNEQVFEGEGILEITKEQYESLIQDRYHFLRIFYGSRFSIRVEENRYYIQFHDFPFTDDSFDRQLKVSEDAIVNRIEQLVNFLVSHNVEIQMVCICRSRISGYTPDDQCQFIEKTLLEKLGETYEINAMSIDQVLAEQGLNQSNVVLV